MRFTDNQDGTITDQETGLMWQQGTMGKKDWDHAILACSELNLAGHKDWRLPTIKELLSIVDFERHNPTCDPVFNAQSDGYWSSSTGQSSPALAWYVYFSFGYTNALSKTNGYDVRAVRAGSCPRPTRQPVTELLAEREQTHGAALDNALAYSPENPLQYPLDMIRVKLARLQSGDRRHKDHWADIEGYARMALGFLED
jgi:hypothetical protein